MVGGFKNSEVTLIAGESNNGKSMVIANIAANIALHTKMLYITLEMQPRKVGDRMKYALGGGKEYQKLDIDFQKTFTIDYRSLRPLFTNAEARRFCTNGAIAAAAISAAVAAATCGKP